MVAPLPFRRRAVKSTDEWALPVDVPLGLYRPAAKHSAALPPRERRRQPRESFVEWQRVAERRPELPASLAEQRSVRCHDVSVAGLSFWTDRAPTSGEVVVELHLEERSFRVVVAVRHVQSIHCTESPLVLVGCEIIGSAN